MDPGGPARPDGRRRDGGRVLAWAPGLAGTEPTAPVAEPDPIAPQPSATLGELDLAVTPVSVTPPGTWRRAAWFAVAASCVVLIVLVFAASRLAGPESPLDRLDAFPGLPTGGLLTAQPLGPQVHPGPTATTDGARPGGTAAGATAGADGNGPGGGPAAHDGRGDQERRSSRTGTAAPAPSEPRGASTPPEPTVSLLPSTGRPPVTAADLVSATRTFYEQLPRNVDAAWNMVGPRVKVQGFDSFRRQWGDAAEVNLQQVVVDADASSVLATVRIVPADGAERFQTFELVIRQGSSLVIDEIRPVGGSGNKPVG